MTDPSAVPSSISFTGALLFDDKANFVAVPRGSTLAVTQSYLPVAGMTDAGIASPLMLASGSAGLRVVNVSARNVIGSYMNAVGFLTGTAATQNLFSIENPVASGRYVIIKRMTVDGLPTSASAVAFLYHLGRTTAVPTGGSAQSTQKRVSSDPNPVAIVRINPSASFALGNAWVYAPGIVGTLVGGIVPNLPSAIETQSDTNDIILMPGEALAVKADGNATTWNHFGHVFWQESL